MPWAIRVVTMLLALALVAACRSKDARASRAGRERAGEMRRVSELPPEYAALWRAWNERAEDWSERRAAALEDPAQTRFLVDNLVREMMRAWRAGRITTTGSKSLEPFDRARAELLRLGGHSAPVLAELQSLAASDIAELCLALLVEIGEPALPAVLAQMDREESAQARRRAATVLARLPASGAGEGEVRAALALRMREDVDHLVRSRAALALGARAAGDRDRGEVRGLLESVLAGDEDPEVCAAAATALARLGDVRAVPALITYYERTLGGGSRGGAEPQIAGMRVALGALRKLTGVEQALDARGWRDWWREHRSEVTREGS
jgi:hypothetical protein